MDTEKRTNPLKFLLIEDDDDHAKILMRILSKERILNKIERTSDGLEAMEYLYRKLSQEPGALPDVILLDLKLPKKDGHEVLAEIKQHPVLRSIPVVILTTSAAEKDKLKAYQHYANSYLVKPLAIESFRQMVVDLSLYWGIWNQSAEEREILS